MESPLASVKSLSRTKTNQIEVVRTLRKHDLRVGTTLPAGKMVPVAMIPLLREDQLSMAKIRLSFESMETAEILMNAIGVNVKAYLVSNLCSSRFQGMDDLNRSYEGEPPRPGDAVIPFVERAAFGAIGSNKIWQYLGEPGKATDQVNQFPIEAYNAIWNFRARNRSPDINLRTRLQTDLAPAFWQHSQFAHIVPNFDAALMEGAIPVTMLDTSLVVTRKPNAQGWKVFQAGTNSKASPVGGYLGIYADDANGSNLAHDNGGSDPKVSFDPMGGLIAELAEGGMTLSLANIELAQKTQAFAKLRQQFTGHTDEYIINLLMDGISVPEQAWRQPILLADKTTIFGQAKRYATDSGNLDESVVNGVTQVDLQLVTPKVPMGGVVMIVVEALPEQLFERQRSPYVHAQSVDDFPQYLRDTLDPQKVVEVKNGFIDASHSTPNGVFGYAPMGHEWAQAPARLGGPKFYNPAVGTALDENRMRVWAVETVDPTLSEDFYISTAIHQKVFLVTDEDPFECVVRGTGIISGLTVFGSPLLEASGDFEAVYDEAPIERIEQD